MQVAVLDNDVEIGKTAAKRIAALIRKDPKTTLGLATGSSPLPTYRELIRLHQEEGLSFAATQAFCLDEYVGLSADHPEGYRNFIEREFTGQVDFVPGAVHAPAGSSSEPMAAAAEYDAQIKAAGGIDVQILGLGSDGHIGFNEPYGSFSSRTHVGMLTNQTRQDNARFFAGDVSQVPQSCITQGLGTIMEARELIMVATGKAKAKAVKELVEGPVCAAWPATIMQFHNDAVILLDHEAASLLTCLDEVKVNWDGYLRYEWAD